MGFTNNSPNNPDSPQIDVNETLLRLQQIRQKASRISEGNASTHTNLSASDLSASVSTKEETAPKVSGSANSGNSVSSLPLAGNKKLIAIACSTGGPQALHTLIPMLPGHLGVPVVIVQHMPNGFTASLAERLDVKSSLKVKEAEDNEALLPDVVYLAPGGRHLEVLDKKGKLFFRVFDDPPVNNLRPCADVMYDSLRFCSLDNILCVVLTGMGADGSQGIKDLKEKKNIYVITQSEDTCVVYGMPKATDKLGLSNESVPLTGIANSITKKMGV